MTDKSVYRKSGDEIAFVVELDRAGNKVEVAMEEELDVEDVDSIKILHVSRKVEWGKLR